MSEERALSVRKFCNFLQIRLNFKTILTKLMLLKRGIEISIGYKYMIKLGA